MAKNAHDRGDHAEHDHAEHWNARHQSREHENRHDHGRHENGWHEHAEHDHGRNDGGGHGLGKLFSADFRHADALYFADITPLNNSGVHGEAILALNGDILTVKIAATGLDPAFIEATSSNEVHPLHIHGFAEGDPDSMIPTHTDDADHDGFVEVAEGAHDYGPILLSLKVDGAFPTAPDGTFVFTETYKLPSAAIPNPIAALSELGLTGDVPLDRREIVIHGLTLSDGEGGTNDNSILPPVGLNEADGTAGYKLALPVAAGEIFESQGHSAFSHFLNGVGDLA